MFICLFLYGYRLTAVLVRQCFYIYHRSIVLLSSLTVLFLFLTGKLLAKYDINLSYSLTLMKFMLTEFGALTKFSFK